MFCENQMLLYKDKNNNKKFTRISNFENELKYKQFLKSKILNREYNFIGCGKCQICLESKKRNYNNRVNSQFKQSNFAYLLTLTFNEKNIPTLLNNNQKQLILNSTNNLSEYSNLSKIKINNIIKNIKNKLNRHYKEKINLHYFLTGEYGGNTERAHYHMILMLEKPLPNLTKKPVRGNHWETPLLNSKQYGHYDLEPVYLTDNKNISYYLSKYLTKDINSDKLKYNNFEEQQIFYMQENNIDLNNSIVIKNKEQMINMFYYLLNIKDNIIIKNPELNFKPITYQKEFIKYSRKLGIQKNNIENIKNNVFLPYYRNKYKKDVLNIEPDNQTLNWIDPVLKTYEQKRINNIKKYFGKETKITKNKNNSKKDIF